MLLHDYYPEETRVVSEARAAVAAGFEVDVLALRGQGEADEEILEGVKVIRLPVEHRQGGAALALLRECLLCTTPATIHAARRSRSPRDDVVQGHKPPHCLLFAARLPRLAGTKFRSDAPDPPREICA